MFLLGLMTDYLFKGAADGGSWWAKVGYAVIPNWQQFWLADALEDKKSIPWTYVLKAGRAKESRQVWREKDGLGVNTHLRLRLVTNNGVTALLGLSNANKNSILTLKIQQDAVATLLAAVKRVRIAIA